VVEGVDGFVQKQHKAQPAGADASNDLGGERQVVNHYPGESPGNAG
jgi:hypothetical protein